MPVFLITFFVNFLLFAFKLYVGLSSNSISIYSDGINNLFDGLSSLVALACFYILARSRDLSSDFRARKTEQLLTFALSVMITAIGFVFLYNSAERLMYPSPVWFTVSYFYILTATAAVKLFMFFFLRSQAKKKNSDVIRVMSVDSLMDFFVNAVTVATLFLSQKGSYSFDALCGIVISMVILISGIRMIKSAVGELLGVPEKSLRSKAEEILSEYGFSEEIELEFSFGKEKCIYVKNSDGISSEELYGLKSRILKETGMNIYLLK